MRFLFLPLLFSVLAGSVPASSTQGRLRVATTTSVQDSGLMTFLLPYFEVSCRCRVDVIAVGSGQALKLASNGDVDLVIAHDPEGEEAFLESGLGINRRSFMYNTYVVLGPPEDPAGIRGMKDAALALAKVRRAGATFISRGDGSGTHQKEKALWRKSGGLPTGSWYLQIGQGMGALLTMANEKLAYALADRATYTARMNQLRIQVLVEGDPELLNFYSAIQVNPARFPAVRADQASRLIDWLCAAEAQKLIAGYTVGGHTLFMPNCIPGK